MTSQPPKVYFKKASKSLAKAKIAITGPSGAGKTYSSLLLAKGLTNNGKVGVIDTENGSADLYENEFNGWEYFTLKVNPPYTVQKYLLAIDAAMREGMDCIIIDSLSHVWAAEGGLLQQKEALDSRGGNSYTNWGNITKLYEEMKSKILHSNIHMVVTMRSKQEYVLEQNDKGKQAPRKVGLAPIMRDGMEYEFTVVFDVGMDHQYMVSKSRIRLFDGVVEKISEKTGEDIRDWLVTAPPEAAPPPPPQPSPTTAQLYPSAVNVVPTAHAPHVYPNPIPDEAHYPPPPYDPSTHFDADPSWDALAAESLSEPDPQFPQQYQQQYPAAVPPPMPLPQEAPRRAAAPLKNHAPQDQGPGFYVCKGGKYNGVQLNNIPPNDMSSYIAYLKKGGPLRGWQIEMAQQFENYSGLKI